MKERFRSMLGRRLLVGSASLALLVGGSFGARALVGAVRTDTPTLRPADTVESPEPTETPEVHETEAPEPEHTPAPEVKHEEHHSTEVANENEDQNDDDQGAVENHDGDQHESDGNDQNDSTVEHHDDSGGTTGDSVESTGGSTTGDTTGTTGDSTPPAGDTTGTTTGD